MTDEKKDVKDVEEVEETEQVEEQDEKDKPVEKSLFSKYREAYLTQRLSDLGVKDDAEMDAAIKFIDERTDETDSNIDVVIDELKARMRLEQRRTYVDPSAGNGLMNKPVKKNGYNTGVETYQRLKRKGKR